MKTIGALWRGLSFRAKAIIVAGAVVLLGLVIWFVAGRIHDGRYTREMNDLRAAEQQARIDQAKAQGEKEAAQRETVEVKKELENAKQELDEQKAEVDRLRAVSDQSVRTYQELKRRPARRTVTNGVPTDEDIRAAIQRATGKTN